MSTAEEMARQAQEAMRVSGGAYRKELEIEIHLAKQEPGIQKVLMWAKDMRSRALFQLSNGTKEKFDACQATYRVWDKLVEAIEVGPSHIDQG